MCIRDRYTPAELQDWIPSHHFSKIWPQAEKVNVVIRNGVVLHKEVGRHNFLKSRKKPPLPPPSKEMPSKRPSYIRRPSSKTGCLSSASNNTALPASRAPSGHSSPPFFENVAQRRKKSERCSKKLSRFTQASWSLNFFEFLRNKSLCLRRKKLLLSLIHI